METKLELQGYQEAIDGAAFYIVSDGGYLRVAGEDRLDFIQRQTTNNMNLLTGERVIRNVLTSATARILDVFTVVDEDESLALLTLPGKGGVTTAFFKSRIFFMDKVTVNDLSSDFVRIEIEGAQADRVLADLSITETLEIDGVGRVDDLLVISRPGFLGRGYTLIIPTDQVDDLLANLGDQHIAEMSAEVYDMLRIEAGFPGEGSELTEDYTPLEVKLNDYVSDNKGCYTGQEIIARQITYDKVVKSLVRIQLSGEVEVGAEVGVDGKKVGVLTSIIESPRLGWVGIGIVKRPHHEIGTSLMVDGEVSGQVF